MTDSPQSNLSDDSTEERHNLEELNFEQLYARLEEVTARMEHGDLNLEQSVSLYEEGIELAIRCQRLLGDVEQRIETLREAFESTEEIE